MKAFKLFPLILVAVALCAALFAVPAVSEATGPRGARVAVLRDGPVARSLRFAGRAFAPRAVFVDANDLRFRGAGFRSFGVSGFGVRGFRALDVHDLRALEFQRALELRRLGFGRDFIILR